MNSKKSQISIFLVIIAILFVLIAFLIISSNLDSRNNNKILQEESTQDVFNIYNFYESSQSCLGLASKKAILLVSLRGGIIYPNENTQEFLGGLNTLNLNIDYVRNLNLEISSIQQFMLPSLSTKNNIVRLQKNNLIEEIEHYITRDFVECQSKSLDTTNLKNLSYSIINPSSVTKMGSQYSYSVNHLKARNGDSILLYTPQGSITNGIYNSTNQKIITNEQFNFDENIIAIINDSFSIEVSLDENIFTSKIKTTDSFTSSSNQVDRGDIENTIETPFYTLLNDLDKILYEKMENRSFRLNNSDDISSLRLDNNVKLTIENVIDNNEEIFQFLILSHNDISKNYEFDSIVGIYKNTAPIIDQNEFQKFDDIKTDLSKETAFLMDKISHIEFEDNILHQGKFEFYQDNEIKLYPNGTLEVLVDEGFFSKQLYVTDGELSTPFTINFNLGGSLNEKNSQFESCFEVTYNLGTLDTRYDAHNQFIDNSTRKIKLKRVQPSTNFEWYGIVSRGTSNTVQVSIDKNDECFSSLNFDKTLPHTFTLSSANRQESITIRNLDGGGNLIGEPFVVNIGSTDCLGPAPIPTQSGIGTCCDITTLYPLWESADEYADFNAIYSNNFISSVGTVGFEFDELNVCAQSPPPVNLTSWNNASIFKTQNLTTQVQVICQGSSPILEENQFVTQGGESFGMLTPTNSPNTIELKYTFNNFLNECFECEFSSSEEENFVLEDSFGNNYSIGGENIIRSSIPACLP